MSSRGRFGMMSYLVAAGIVDSLALVSVVFAAIVNVRGDHPVLSAWAMLSALVMLVVLASIAVVDERPSRRID